MELFRLFATIGINCNEFNRGMDDASAKASGFGKVANGLTGAVKAVGAAIAVVSTAALGLATAAVKVGADFEQSMSKVGAISGANAKDMERLGDKAKEMGSKTVFSASQSAEAFQYMAMAGWKTEEMLGGIEGIMNLAAASGESLATTSDIVTDALTAFGLSAADSGRFADVLAAASSNANTNVSMMGETFKYAAPVAGALGYSIDDTAVAIGLMANAGIKASQAGTSLRTIMTNMSKVTEELGVETTNLDGSMRPLNDVLVEARAEFANLSEAQQVEAATTIAGRNAMSGFLAIMNATEADFNKLTDAVANSNGVSLQMAEIMNDNLGGAITILKSGLEGLAIQFYESVDNPLKDVVTKAQGYVNDLAVAFSEGGLAAAFAELGNILADVAVELVKAAPAFLQVGIDLISSLVGGLVSATPKLVDAAVKLIPQVAAAITKLLPEIIVAGVSIITALIKGIANEAPKLVREFGKLSKDFLKALADGLRDVSPIFKPIAAAVDFLGTHFEKLRNAVIVLTTAFVAFKAGVAISGILTALAASLNGVAIATKLVTAAQWLWNAALTANPIGLIVAGVAALTAGIVLLVSWMNRESDAAYEMRKANDELADGTSSLVDSINSSAKAYEDKQSALAAEIGASKNLLEKIKELSAVENKSAEDKKRLASYVEMLNSSMEGLNLQYDEENDALSQSIESIEKQINLRAEQAKAAAAQERAVQIAKEQIEVEEQLHKVKMQIQDWFDALQRGEITQKEYQKGISELGGQLGDLSAKTRELNASFEYTTEVMVESGDKAAKYGAEVEAAMDSAGDAMSGLADAAYEMSEAQEKAFKKLTDVYEELTSSAMDMFNALSDEFDETMVANAAETLENNRRVMEQWGDNMAFLSERVSGEFLEHLKSLGINGAGYVAALADASEEELARMEEAFYGARDSVEDAMIKAFNLSPATVQQIRDFVADTGVTFEQAISELGFDRIGASTMDGFVAGIKSRLDAVASGAREAANTAEWYMKQALDSHSPSKVFEGIGVDTIDGFIIGMEEMSPEVAKTAYNIGGGVADDMTDALGVAESDNIFERIGKGVVNSLAGGLNNGAPKVVETAGEVGAGVTKGIINATGAASDVFGDVGEKMMSDLNKGLHTAGQRLGETAKGIGTGIVGHIKTGIAAADMSDIFGKIGDAMTSGLNKSITFAMLDVAKTIKNIGEGIVKMVKNVFGITSDKSGAFEHIGKGLMAGLNSGIVGMAKNVMNTLRSIAESITKTMKSIFGIASPSKVFAEIGKNLGEGFIGGIKSLEKSIDETAGKVFGGITDGIDTDFDITANFPAARRIKDTAATVDSRLTANSGAYADNAANAAGNSKLFDAAEHKTEVTNNFNISVERIDRDTDIDYIVREIGRRLEYKQRGRGAGVRYV